MPSILKSALFALCLMLVFAFGSASAELVAVPTLQQRVTDLTQTLTVEQQSLLEAKLATFEQQKGSQIAVLIVPSTQPEAIEQYSIRVTDVWKLGREKQDDGILILIAKNDRKMRIEVGYGLEGAIPDLIAKRIITEVMAPHFKQGDYYGGIDNAIDKLIALISGEQLAVPDNVQSNDGMESYLFPLLIVALVIGGLLRAIFGKFLGGMVSGGVIALLVWLFGGTLLIALVLGMIAFFITLVGASGLGHIGGMSGRSSGGFSGGGGGFGGGGASGDW